MKRDTNLKVYITLPFTDIVIHCPQNLSLGVIARAAIIVQEDGFILKHRWNPHTTNGYLSKNTLEELKLKNVVDVNSKKAVEDLVYAIETIGYNGLKVSK